MDDQGFPGFRHLFAFWGVLLVIQRNFLTPLPLFIEPKVCVPVAPIQNTSIIQEPVYADATPLILGFEELDWLLPYLAVLLPIVVCFLVYSGLAYLVRMIINHDDETPKPVRMAKCVWDFAMKLARNNSTIEAIRFLARSLLHLDHGRGFGEHREVETKRTLLWNATLSVFPIAIVVLYLITVPIPNLNVSYWTGIPNPYLIASFTLVLVDIVLLQAYFAAKGSASRDIGSGVCQDESGEEAVNIFPIEGDASKSQSKRQRRQRKKAARQQRAFLQDRQHTSDSDYEGGGESDDSQDSTKNQTDSSPSISTRFLPSRTPKGAKVIKPRLRKPNKDSPTCGPSSSKENTPVPGSSRDCSPDPGPSSPREHTPAAVHAGDPLQEADGRTTAELSETRNSTPSTEHVRQHQATPPVGFLGDIGSLTFSPCAASTPVRYVEGQAVVEPLVLLPVRDGRCSKPSLVITPTSGHPSLQVQQPEESTGRFTFRYSVPLRQDGRILCSLPARPAQALLSPRLTDGRQDTWTPPQGLFIGTNVATRILPTSNRGTKVLWSTIPPPQPAARHVRRRLI